MRFTVILTAALLAFGTGGVVTGAHQTGVAAAKAVPVNTAPMNTAPMNTVPAAYTPVPPVRVLDTRIGLGAPTGPVGGGGTVALDLAARVPATATAVVLNLTGVSPTAPTFVTVYPHGGTRPVASNLNLVAGDIVSNLVTVGLGTGRRLALYNNAGSTHLVADLAGYYASDAASRYTALLQTPVLDTRDGGLGEVGPGGVVSIDLSDRVPASATAVTMQVSGVDPTASTFLTVWPAGAPRPTASNVNLSVGRPASNLVTVALGTGRRVSIFNHVGQVHVLVDLAGFHTPDYGALFVAVPPNRVLDTRSAGGGGPLVGGSWRQFDVPGVSGGAIAAVLNVTGTQASTQTELTVAADRYQGVSNLHLVAGQTAARLGVVGLDDSRYVYLHNDTGTAHLVVDLVGYFIAQGAGCGTGCVSSWGSNERGQLGRGTNRHSLSPGELTSLSDATSIAAGTQNGYAIRSDGTVVAWGDNQLGQLGNGWLGHKSPVPVPVIGLTAVTAISAGSNGAIALRENGTVWAWGLLTPSRSGSLPVPMAGLTDVVTLAAGGLNAFAVRADGTLWSWGDNERGQLGTGTVCVPATGAGCISTVPVRVPSLTNITAVSNDGPHSFAVRDDGTAWAWGDNSFGGLGNGSDCRTNCIRTAPTRVANLSGVTGIAGDGTGGIATLQDGTVWQWGGYYDDYTVVPERNLFVTGATAAAGGWTFDFALTD